MKIMSTIFVMGRFVSGLVRLSRTQAVYTHRVHELFANERVRGGYRRFFDEGGRGGIWPKPKAM